MNETETQTRLRRATEALADYREAEHQARKKHFAAIEDSRKAKEKMSELFQRDQAEQVAKMKASYL